MLSAQIPAEGIMKTHQFDNSVFYHINCDCSNYDDRIEMVVEYDKEFDEILVEFYSTQKTDWWKKLAKWDVYKIENSWLFSIVYFIQSFINGFYHRLKLTKNIWIDGYLKYESTTILNKQSALNMVEAIKNSIEELEKK